MSIMIDGFQKLLRRRHASQVSRPAPVLPPAGQAQRGASPVKPPAAQAQPSVLPTYLEQARQRFCNPYDEPCYSLFVAADLTAAHLSPQECVSLLLETTDDIRTRVYQRAGWFRPLNTGARELTHTLRCLASMILEYHLRESSELVMLERELYGRGKWPPSYPDPRFGFPVSHEVPGPKA